MASKRTHFNLTEDVKTDFKTKKVKISLKAETDSNSEKLTTTSSEYFEKKTEKKNIRKKVNIVIAPEGWKEIYENIHNMRTEKMAPVDTMGVQTNLSDKISPAESRFHVLISLIISSRTKDTTNSFVMDKLRVHGLTIENIRNTSLQELTELVHPAGFKNTKAKHIKKVAEIMHERYADDVPGDYDDILALPGVGPKMALLMMNVAWNKTIGISVDTHVHRISNRLKWTGAKGTGLPEQTRKALEDWLPREYWAQINGLLVGFGQQICRPINPLCSKCLNRHICPSSNSKK